MKNIEAIFKTYDSETPGIWEAKLGSEVRAILNYEVIEKTKNFVITKIHYVHLVKSKRQL